MKFLPEQPALAPIQLLTNFIVSNSSYKNDINNINKYGLWNYLSQSKKGDYLANLSLHKKY